jgi:hypothetical protein
MMNATVTAPPVIAHRSERSRVHPPSDAATVKSAVAAGPDSAGMALMSSGSAWDTWPKHDNFYQVARLSEIAPVLPGCPGKNTWLRRNETAAGDLSPNPRRQLPSCCQESQLVGLGQLRSIVRDGALIERERAGQSSQRGAERGGVLAAIPLRQGQECLGSIARYVVAAERL